MCGYDCDRETKKREEEEEKKTEYMRHFKLLSCMSRPCGIDVNQVDVSTAGNW